MSKYAVVDVETSGGTPQTSRITEIAVFIHDGSQVVANFHSLINPDRLIDPFVVQLTGITQEMVADAPFFGDIAEQIAHLTRDCIFVAHNVSFDYGMLRHEFKLLGQDFRLPHLCTVRAAKHILPEEESYSLGKLCRALSIPLHGRHRADGDALATSHLLRLLLTKDSKKVTEFIQPEIVPAELNPHLDLASVDDLPALAGVYSLINEMNQVIFMGASEHIKNAVRTHLMDKSTPSSDTLRKETIRVGYQLTGSHLIAQLLLARQFKSKTPAYNLMQHQTILNLADSSFSLPAPSFFIIGKGRNKSEKSILYIEKESVKGWAFLHFTEMKKGNTYWKNKIDYQVELPEDNAILARYLKKAKSSSIKLIES